MVRFMPADPFNLAIETSSRCGSVALGRGDELLATAAIGRQRHGVALMPAIDRLCGEWGIGPAGLGEVSVSIGPGSFTGLRIAVTTAKMLGRSVGAKLVAVPTLDVVVRNVPDAPDGLAGACVMLNAKRGQCFTGLYEHRDGRWQALGEASLMTPAEVCDALAGAFVVIGDHLPAHAWPARARLLDASFAAPRVEMLWRLGRSAAKRGSFIDPLALKPLYVRLPEAEEVWQRDHGS